MNLNELIKKLNLKSNDVIDEEVFTTIDNNFEHIKQHALSEKDQNTEQFNTINNTVNELNTKVDDNFDILHNIIDVEELPSAILKTAVPNSGYVEKVYFNTDLSNEEVESLLSQLTYPSAFSINTLLYSNSPTKIEIIVVKQDNMYVLTTTGGETIYWVNQAAVDTVGTNIGITTAGWQDFTNPIEINAEVLSQFDASTPVGAENELIKDLFYIQSSTLNPDLDLSKIYRVANYSAGSGAVVPNSGTVGKVYFNTNLSDEEITNLLGQLTYKDYINVIFASGTNLTDATFLQASNLDNEKFAIVYVTPSSTTIIWCNEAYRDFSESLGQTITKAGWQNFTNPIEINMPTQSTIENGSSSSATQTVGAQNDIIKDLVYTEPLVKGELLGYQYYRVVNGEWIEVLNGGSGGGSSDFIDVEELPIATLKIAVPNSGHVEKVYFNTSLSENEVEALLSQLTYDDGASLLLANNSIQIAAMSLDGIMGIIDFATETVYWVNQTCADRNGITAGWHTFSNPIKINAEVVADLNGDGSLIVGAENELIKELFYMSSPNPDPDIDLSKIYRVPNYSLGGGTAVPNNGTVDKVYFNTNLSDEQIETILSKLTYDPDMMFSNSLLAVTDEEGFPAKLFVAVNGEGACALLDFINMEIYWANQLAVDILGTEFDIEGITAGWQTFDNPIELNAEALADPNGDGSFIVGAENELIKELFYIEPLVEPGIVGYNYYRAIDGEWAEVLGKAEGLPAIIIEKDYDAVRENTATYTAEEINYIVNHDNVYLKLKNTGTVVNNYYLKKYHTSEPGDYPLVMINFTVLNGNNLLEVNLIYVAEQNRIVTLTWQNEIVAFGSYNLVSVHENDNDYYALHHLRNNESIEQGKIPYVTTIDTSYSLTTSKAVKTYVDEQVANAGLTEDEVNTLIANYMSANYGNGDTEKY